MTAGDALKARIVQMNEALANGEELRAELLERATYLEAVDDGQLSTIERQSMATLYRAADYLATRTPTTEAGVSFKESK